VTRASLVAVAVAIAAATAAGDRSGVGSVPPPTNPPVARFVAPQLDAQRLALSHLVQRRTSSWVGGHVTAATGEAFTVYVSEAYDPGGVQRWADFFASLVHGDELSRLTAYVATPADVQELCSSPDALGCYRSQQLVIVGEATSGLLPEDVARHEYGHHVAFNRSNPPWRAVDWGTKRWGTHMGVCAHAASGAAYPGDEGDNYRLNPGEGFAEAYRVLNELRAGGTAPLWPIVDALFRPDEIALRIIEEDVLRPWEAPVSSVMRGGFRAGGAPVWQRAVATPLDGDLTVVFRLPAGTTYDVTIRAADGRVLARSLWSGATTKIAGFTVCGQREVILRVVRRGTPGRFSLRILRP
jgi:hypothetical protein